MNITFRLLVSGLAVLLAASCASWDASNKESLLSAAGFQTRTPATARQQQIFSSMPPYKIQRLTLQGQVVYLYKDQRKGVVWIGGEKEYQKFQQLAVQQQIADTQLTAAMINEDAAMEYAAWGPWGIWW